MVPVVVDTCRGESEGSLYCGLGLAQSLVWFVSR